MSVIEYNQDILTRFWDKVKFTTDCWEWIGGKKDIGYGFFRLNDKVVRSHRFSYELYKGEIPKDKEIDHLCRNKTCVNPHHLEVVTHKENMVRAGKYMSGNQYTNRTHCLKGHEFNKENTCFYKNTRQCRICHKLRCRGYRKNE